MNEQDWSAFGGVRLEIGRGIANTQGHQDLLEYGPAMVAPLAAAGDNFFE